ncbi:hypothetical protein L6164_032340 [Bauhinia variegata]|uniref:Uncharacterized protein n=1 Tax=Bauhinia variegata TaxID=167791 RepID=A0ACB9KNI7_BAUVA|nr:hypothetical protein L6164_032340 [Bauhinia variegata]
MGSKALASSAIFLSLNLLFFTMVSSTSACSPTPAYKTPQYSSPVPKAPSPINKYSNAKCSIDTLKLGVCAKVLDLVNVKIGSPPTLPCCNLLRGLADLEAAACLCTAIRANVLGLNLKVSVALSVILNNCGKNNSAFQCA